ncbi:MAG: A/G-specific adenine glycosylase [Burkholderiaceae bacterium]
MTSMIAERLIDWQRRHGRHDLPWQRTRDAYRIWLSEVMLQQTQVSTVIPYFTRFVDTFPDVAALAAADVDTVLQLWSGLGYYSRARNLHRCAIEVVQRHGGRFPADPQLLAELPGIGRSTAAAIAVFAYGARAAILDGNVKRVLCRHGGVHGFPGERSVELELWRIAERELPADGIEAYTQGLMDLGATVCVRSRPACAACPLADDCSARRDGNAAELPTPRPRKTLPQRRCTLLVLCDGARVLVERRPPTGIWGGLLSLPEVPADAADADMADEIARRFGLRVGAARRLAAFDHTFTHFKLQAQPVLFDVDGAAALAEPAALWLGPDEVPDAALPRPIKTLLQALATPIRA